jgi:hypothetical protein
MTISLVAPVASINAAASAVEPPVLIVWKLPDTVGPGGVAARLSARHGCSVAMTSSTPRTTFTLSPYEENESGRKVRGARKIGTEVSVLAAGKGMATS